MSQSELTVHCPDHPDCKTTVELDGEEVCAACQLEAAKRSKTDRPQRCPNADCGPEELEVGSARISFRVGDDHERYYCKECGADFDEPVYAESEGAEKAVVTDGGVSRDDAIEADCLVPCDGCDDELNRCMGQADWQLTIQHTDPRADEGGRHRFCLSCAQDGTVAEFVENLSGEAELATDGGVDASTGGSEHCPNCKKQVNPEVHGFGGRDQLYCPECGVRLGYA